ncbi:proline and serine-rich protein 2 [Rhinophrynus dorsalis]
MPSNLMKMSSSVMEPEFSSRRMSDFERSSSFDSQGSHRSRSRSSNLDDENLEYLSNEEKNVLLFFEETLFAFEDDIEDPPLLLDTSFSNDSLRSTVGSHSETDDIIDLVQPEQTQIEQHMAPDSGKKLGTNNGKPIQKNNGASEPIIPESLPVTIPARATPLGDEKFSPEVPAEHRKLLGAVPTPVIIAKKISEKNVDNLSNSPIPPKDVKPAELKKSVGTSPIGDGHFIYPSTPNTKLGRFPTNISIKQAGKNYNKTIAKAAVNVQERKAQVLANINGPGLLTEEVDGRVHHEQLCRRNSSFRDGVNEQTRYEALTKLGLVKEIPVQAEMSSPRTPTSPLSPTSPISPTTPTSPTSPISPIANGHHLSKFLPQQSPRKLSAEKESISSILKSEPSPFVPLGKSVFFKGEAPQANNKRHSAPQVIPEQKQQSFHQEVKRSYSMPRPGFRPQGITVQFSGRDSSEETRKDALRRLGLLKEQSGY